MLLKSVSTILLGLGLLTLPGTGSARAAPPRSAEVVAGAWIEERGAQPVLVVALYRRAQDGPEQAYVGCSVSSDEDGPGGYGTIAKEGWTEVALKPGVLVRAERALRPDEFERPPSVIVTAATVSAALNVHHLIHGEVPPATLLFARPWRHTQVTLSRHVLEIGATAELTVAAPPETFLLAETLEVVVASRRLGIDGDDPDAAAGHARLVYLPPPATDPPATSPPDTNPPDTDPPNRELSGAEGERRVRAHFTDPKCPWAERHVGWMTERWVIDLLRAAPVRFRVETDAVARPGVMHDVWRGWNSLVLEAIYPNGFGGSSAGLSLPPLLVLPKATPVRTTPLR